MPANMKRSRKGRPRNPAPMILPDDLYDYVDDRLQRRGASRTRDDDRFDGQSIAVIDDWPEHIPVTEAEIDIFERYFEEVLDRLFGPLDTERENRGLQKLTSDVNNKP